MASSTPDSAALLAYAREIALDTSSTAPGWTDAQWLRHLNRAYWRFWSAFSARTLFDTVNTVATSSSLPYVIISQDYLEIIEVYRRVGVPFNYIPIERKPLTQVQADIIDLAPADPPVSMSLLRSRGTGTGNDSWILWFAPNAVNGATLTLLVKPAPFELTVNGVAKLDGTSAGATLTPDVGPSEALMIAQAAAAMGAKLLGRGDDVVQLALADIPGDVQAALGLARLARTVPTPAPPLPSA